MPQSPRISVALCTFNGERFLSQQLRSLADQSRRPDEVVVCDDGSTDQTIDIVGQFAASAPFPVRIDRSTTTLGPAQNFARAISLCTGEIISCCDQDDIWENNKIEATLAAFAADPQLGFVFSDAEICNADCRPLGYRLWSSIYFTSRLQNHFNAGNGFDVLLRQNIVTGATLSFAAKYRPLILPIGKGWMHDGWIALVLSAVGKAQAISQPLVRYRQHSDQSIGAIKRSLYQQYLNAKNMDRNVFTWQADQYETALARLQEQTDFDVPAKLIQHLQEKIHHDRRRSLIRHRKIFRLPAAITEFATGRYRRFALGWKSFAQDLFL